MKWNGSGGMAAGKKAVRQWGCKHGIGTNEDSCSGGYPIERVSRY